HHYDLYEVDRGIEYKVESFSDEYQSTMALYIFSKSKLEERICDENVINDIKSATTFKAIQKIFEIYSDEQYYSFFELNPDKIVLEKGLKDTYNVLFYGESHSKIYIAKSREMNRAGVVLYNFSIKLSRFYNLMDIIQAEIDSNFKETLKRLYLLG
ncbi:hypothetical protein, partial [Metabacillus lacus]|uniref:hypothetical protein n=1 Tax=Metabacillus lacus TaxID=1983721 RepID=UPI00147904A9